MGIAKCPYDPTDNSTAVWVEHGNPGDLPGLYSGRCFCAPEKCFFAKLLLFCPVKLFT